MVVERQLGQGILMNHRTSEQTVGWDFKILASKLIIFYTVLYCISCKGVAI